MFVWYKKFYWMKIKFKKNLGNILIKYKLKKKIKIKNENKIKFKVN